MLNPTVRENLLFPSSSPSARRPRRFPQVQSMVADAAVVITLFAEICNYNENSSLIQSAYSALVNGSSVCAGYSRALFQRLRKNTDQKTLPSFLMVAFFIVLILNVIRVMQYLSKFKCIKESCNLISRIRYCCCASFNTFTAICYGFRTGCQIGRSCCNFFCTC